MLHIHNGKQKVRKKLNNVTLIGRLTRDPEVTYTAGTQMAVCKMTLAIDRPVAQGAEKKTDFPRVIVFGKQAENCERFLKKGRLVAVSGSIQTGSYTGKDNQTVYTTDVVANRVEFLEWGDKEPAQARVQSNDPVPSEFEAIEEDIPF